MERAVADLSDHNLISMREGEASERRTRQDESRRSSKGQQKSWPDERQLLSAVAKDHGAEGAPLFDIEREERRGASRAVVMQVLP